MTILETIVAHKRGEIAARMAATPLTALLERLPAALPPRDFRAALLDSASPGPRVIAEVKRRSPSKGALRPDLDPVELARIYEENGAAAISVLTDDRFFGGSLDDLHRVRASVSLPVLCKEFIIAPYQLYEARLAGADAVLLIAGILTREQLTSFREQAAQLGMASLIEVHNRAELDSALTSGAEIIGINNRDLHTFTVSLDTTRTLRASIPPGITTVSESGIMTADDRALMSSLAIDALLVGESLLTSADVAAATREISGLSAPRLEESLR
ncbi:MAG: indole-3-glycerol phosphate synthase TrpC [Chloroflexota bacterium]